MLTTPEATIDSATQVVVLVSFPISDPSQAKLRPAIVLADAGREDWILCQIPNKPNRDSIAITLVDHDFSRGSLKIQSYERPGKLFTANQSLMKSQVGTLNKKSFENIIASVMEILRPLSGNHDYH